MSKVRIIKKSERVATSKKQPPVGPRSSSDSNERLEDWVETALRNIRLQKEADEALLRKWRSQWKTK